MGNARGLGLLGRDGPGSIAVSWRLHGVYTVQCFIDNRNNWVGPPYKSFGPNNDIALEEVAYLCWRCHLNKHNKKMKKKKKKEEEEEKKKKNDKKAEENYSFTFRLTSVSHPHRVPIHICIRIYIRFFYPISIFIPIPFPILMSFPSADYFLVA